ncbi:hypothetical protein BKP45_11965 [Anaerobacillus alkalidiazotrophicus]|uniref:Cytochrome c-552/4 domain-containing protein n=1 Tax=Anaerobacillus alkalidiazotrophicus TaxID=472963 RepID=A0A1S2M0P4_9BACI|nr:multiheme c-type cytochrome [Anaerobacillus alkalidiazotrophicus]OIJ18292.1 hypothetical protein BKP45_17680 [Anaerobacillus alkalidiazotrophicus]OIJ19771.1 hypothetical protein BKP45_11965 [Anaerobacillus alkalidiazotrophicus]
MKNIRLLVLSIVLLILVVFAVGCQTNTSVGGQPVKPTFPTEPTAEVVDLITNGSYYDKFVGPERCMDCHEEKYEKWETSWHTAKTTEGPNLGSYEYVWDWVFDQWEQMDSYLILDQKDSNTIYLSTKKYELSEVDYVVGSVRKQRYMVYYDGSPQEAYLATTEDGGISWNLDKSEKVQFEGNKERAGYNFLFLELTPKQEIKTYGTWRSWQEQCIACHTTGFDPDAWEEAKEEYINGEREDLRETFTVDTRVSCESCHGPGLEHVYYPLREGTIINPVTMDGDVDTRKLVCEQCHTRNQTNLMYGNGSNDFRGFQLGVHDFNDYLNIIQYTRPAWGEGNRQVSIDGKGRRDHQQDMDIRLQDHIKGGETIHGSMTCFDCHDAHNVGNNPDNLRTFGDTPIANCLTCHGLESEEMMKALDGRTGWDSYGFGNWKNEGGRVPNKQHIFNVDEEGRSFGLSPDQYIWALKVDGDASLKEDWLPIWPWEKDLYREKGQRVSVGAEPWNQ